MEWCAGPVGVCRSVGRIGDRGAGVQTGDGEGGETEGRGLGLYYYRDDHGAAAVVVADPLTDDAAG